MRTIKRSLAMLLCCMVLTTSITTAYYESVYSAELVGGLIASIGGAPLLTALVIGGVVVAGGIAIHEIAQTNSEDYRDFFNGIKNGFNEFVTEQETIIAKENNSSLSDQEASDIGVANARETVNNFFSSAINTTKNTVNGLKSKAQQYWDSYSRIINDVADNGISDSNGSISVGTPLNKTAYPDANLVGYSAIFDQLNPTIKEDTTISDYNGKKYVTGGRIVLQGNTINNQANAIPFIVINFEDWSWTKVAQVFVYSYYTNTGTIVGGSTYFQYMEANNGMAGMYPAINASAYPIIFTSGVAMSNVLNYVSANLSDVLAIGGNTEIVPTWKRTINGALSNTHIGKSIQTGRRTLVNNGDYVGSIFVEDSIPVKKQGLQVNEGVATGTIGWDIPAGDVWDDYLAGNIPFPDVVGGTGTIVVPRPSVESYPTDSTVDFPAYSTVTDSKPNTANPDIPNETTPDDVIDEQGGTFYPTALDLTNIFPFCIPFDIIYIVQEYWNVEEIAPVIQFKIPYPNAIKSSLGDYYSVTVDFNDYVAIRNIIRIFILLLFIAGLMKITRDIIRG